MVLVMAVLAVLAAIYLGIFLVIAIKKGQKAKAREYAIVLGLFVILTPMLLFKMRIAWLLIMLIVLLSYGIVLLINIWQIINSYLNHDTVKIKKASAKFVTNLICNSICAYIFWKLGYVHTVLEWIRPISV